MPAPFHHIYRQELVEQFGQSVPNFDLCVVGGGITGAGIARDAALKGLKVLLLEKKDFAWGTSSRSSKLVHGGVRYLENLEFGLVFESTQERALLWKNAPQLCTPLPFLFPAFDDSEVPLWKLNLGLWLYDILATFRVPSRHKKFNKRETLEQEPMLKGEGLQGSIFYWDGATNDARLTLANVIDAHELGASILSRCSLDSVEWNEKVGSDPAAHHTLHLSDQLGKGKLVAKAKSIIAAAGPWSDEILSSMGVARKSKLLATTRGSHLVVPKDKLSLKHAIVLNHPSDERVMFAIPWGDFTVVGTTDIYDEESPDHTHVSKDEVKYMIDAANDYFPGAQLEVNDVVSVWSGLRPLIRPDDEASESKISREHHLEWFDQGLLVIAGGKLTTYRKMAAECVEAVLRESQYWKHPLIAPSARMSTKHRALPRLEYPSEKRDGQIGKSEAGHLSADDVKGCLERQMVLSLEDFMLRRTDLYYKESNNGLDMLPELKRVFCDYFDWSDKRWEEEVTDYKSFVAKQNEWKL